VKKVLCSWESPFANCLAGRSRWRLPQSRDRELQGSTHFGYCVHGAHLPPTDPDRRNGRTPATRCATGFMPVAVSPSKAPPTRLPRRRPPGHGPARRRPRPVASALRHRSVGLRRHLTDRPPGHPCIWPPTAVRLDPLTRRARLRNPDSRNIRRRVNLTERQESAAHASRLPCDQQRPMASARSADRSTTPGRRCCGRRRGDPMCRHRRCDSDPLL
jgi:hypothetical protein